MAEFLVGQLVYSRQGKDAGLAYIVSGLSETGRVKVIRPPKFNTSHPKTKNPKHLQPTQERKEELSAIIEAGQDIDAGYFHRSVGS